MKGIKLGEVLVEQGVLTERQVGHILKIQKTTGRPFGDLAERLYGIEPQAVEGAWVTQYARLAGQTDLDAHAFDADCLTVVSRRQAWQFHIAPLVRDGEHLIVATTQDNLVRAVNFATRTFDEPVYFVLATPEQLDAFLMKHYPVPAFLAEYAAQLA